MYMYLVVHRCVQNDQYTKEIICPDSNYLCGDAYLTCPLNSKPYYGGCTFTNNSKCSSDQILFNITEYDNPKKFHLMCGEKWYRG